MQGKFNLKSNSQLVEHFIGSEQDIFEMMKVVQVRPHTHFIDMDVLIVTRLVRKAYEHKPTRGARGDRSTERTNVSSTPGSQKHCIYEFYTHSLSQTFERPTLGKCPVFFERIRRNAINQIGVST